MNLRRKIKIFVLKSLMIVSTLITCGIVLFILIDVMIKGIPNINLELLTSHCCTIRGRSSRVSL